MVGVCPEGASLRIGISAPAALAPYIAAKGSVTVEGVSLTVNEVADQSDGTCHFALNIIPHTAEVTTLGALAAGSAVNLEAGEASAFSMVAASISPLPKAAST